MLIYLFDFLFVKQNSMLLNGLCFNSFYYFVLWLLLNIWSDDLKIKDIAYLESLL